MPLGITAAGGPPAGTAGSGGTGQSSQTASPSQSRPAPYTGAGLADPYINEKGELELIFGDARGTVKLGPKQGTVTCASLSRDRLKLAYSVCAGTPPAASERIFLVDASREPWQQRELTPVHDSPVCKLSFSPCGEYLAIDVGTSAVHSLTVVRVSDGTCVGRAAVLGAVWAPGAPARLAVGLVGNRLLVPLTELDQTVDAVVVELPSGRLTEVRRGTANEAWWPLEWQAEGTLKLAHLQMIPHLNEAISVAAPPRAAALDRAPTAHGPLPKDANPHPEVNFAGELLLVSSDGTALRKLTDRSDGQVLDFALAGDGRFLAYIFQRSGEDHTRLFRVSLPDLKTAEITAGRPGAIGYGPKRLSAAPGARPLVLTELSYGLVRVYDLDSGEVVTDLNGWPAVWVPERLAGESPAVVIGELPADAGPLAIGERLSLTLVDLSSGARTVIKEGNDQDSYWPIECREDGMILAVHQARSAETELVRVPLPR